MPSATCGAARGTGSAAWAGREVNTRPAVAALPTTCSTRDGMAEICADNLIAGVAGQPLRAWVNPEVADKRRKG